MIDKKIVVREGQVGSRCPYCEKIASIGDDNKCLYCHNTRRFICSKCDKLREVEGYDITDYSNKDNKFICSKCKFQSISRKDKGGIALVILWLILNNAFVKIIIISAVILFVIYKLSGN